MEVDIVTFPVSFVDCENVRFAVTCWDVLVQYQQEGISGIEFDTIVTTELG